MNGLGSDFKIVDLNGLLNYCNELRSTSKQLNDLVNNLNDNLARIEGLWQSEGASDKISYVKEVSACVNYLVNISNSGLSFAESMETLQMNTVNTQNQTL